MDTVIVAHGLWMPGWETMLLRRRLSAAGFRPLLFRFRTIADGLRVSAERLASFAAKAPGDTLHFVGYSLGGVVAVAMLGERAPARTGRVVCLGSPLRGSRAAQALARLPGGPRVVGKSMLELVAAGGVPPWSGARDLGVVAGDLAVGVGRLLVVLPPPNDGTVCLDETKLRGLRDHIVLPVSHTTMLFSRAVAAQAIHFLRHGRFDR